MDASGTFNAQRFKEQMTTTMAAVQTELVNTFNVGVRDMVKNMITDFPDLTTDLKCVYNKYLLALRLNQRIGIESFHTHVAPFGKMIESKDEKFILAEAPRVPIVQDLKLAQVWRGANTEQRESIWRHTTKLLGIATTYQGTNEVSADSSAMDAFQRFMTRFGKIDDIKKLPKLEDMTGMMLQEMGHNVDDATVAKAREHINRFAKTMLPTQMDKITDMLKARGAFGNTSAADIEEAKRAVLAQLTPA